MHIPDTFQDDIAEIIGGILAAIFTIAGYLARATVGRIERLETTVGDLQQDIAAVKVMCKAAEALQASIERMEETHARQFELLHQSSIALHDRVDRLLMRTPCAPEYRHYDDLDVRERIRCHQIEDRRHSAEKERPNDQEENRQGEKEQTKLSAKGGQPL